MLLCDNTPPSDAKIFQKRRRRDSGVFSRSSHFCGIGISYLRPATEGRNLCARTTSPQTRNPTVRELLQDAHSFDFPYNFLPLIQAYSIDLHLDRIDLLLESILVKVILNLRGSQNPFGSTYPLLTSYSLVWFFRMIMAS